MLNLKKFVSEFNKEFGEPFLPTDFCHAEIVKDSVINIRIGRRDVDFDFAKGGIAVGAGTYLRSAWHIAYNPKDKRDRQPA